MLSADVGTDAQTIDSAWREVLDQDINLLHQPEEQFPAPVPFEIDRQTFFIAVETSEKTGAEPLQPAGVVTLARPLDLVDLGPEIGQDQAAGRPHDIMPQFQYPNPGQGQRTVFRMLPLLDFHDFSVSGIFAEKRPPRSPLLTLPLLFRARLLRLQCPPQSLFQFNQEVIRPQGTAGAFVTVEQVKLFLR